MRRIASRCHSSAHPRPGLCHTPACRVGGDDWVGAGAALRARGDGHVQALRAVARLVRQARQPLATAHVCAGTRPHRAHVRLHVYVRFCVFECMRACMDAQGCVLSRAATGVRWHSPRGWRTGTGRNAAASMRRGSTARCGRLFAPFPRRHRSKAYGPITPRPEHAHAYPLHPQHTLTYARLRAPIDPTPTPAPSARPFCSGPLRLRTLARYGAALLGRDAGTEG